MSQKKKIRRILRIFAVLTFIVMMWYGWRVNVFDRSNRGQQAIVYGKDTCIILSEQRGHFINEDPLTEVRYKDKFGVWHEERVATLFVKKLK